jgi:hypothetical protein
MFDRYVHGYRSVENARLHDQAGTLSELLHSDTASPFVLPWSAVRAEAAAFSAVAPYRPSLLPFRVAGRLVQSWGTTPIRLLAGRPSPPSAEAICVRDRQHRQPGPREAMSGCNQTLTFCSGRAPRRSARANSHWATGRHRNGLDLQLCDDLCGHVILMIERRDSQSLSPTMRALTRLAPPHARRLRIRSLCPLMSQQCDLSSDGCSHRQELVTRSLRGAPEVEEGTLALERCVALVIRQSAV